MKSQYDFKSVENNKYKNKFTENIKNKEKSKNTFTIILPPPNITGKLHLGHAWNNTLQDIIIRRKKMLGFDVLFIPGIDHAGIATQNKIKEKLKKENFKEQDITKKIFLKYASIWKDKYTNKIHNQWNALGLFLNYEREKFTLDSDISELVEKVFIKLYHDGLIYRDYKIINWDPILKTTISNIEVNYKKIQDKLFYLKYFIISVENNIDNVFLEVATTRPETIFADQALMVHPQDFRYQHLIGKKVLVPDTKNIIPIISDTSVDMNFGSGVVKVTPSHDENDFKVGQKYGLKNILCIDSDGKMKKIAGKYENLDADNCRQKLISDLISKNLISKIENYQHDVGFSSISNAKIEPRLSLQWFLKTKDLTLLVLKKHQINFYPARFLKIFNNWLKNLKDWCISRQLWWGHPIPVWYKDNEIKVQKENPGKEFIKDSDVLDTWFSSSLWPLSTLNWNGDDKNLFQKHFPVDVLVTGYDILTFWVSKMILQSINLTKKIPFKNILLHGLIRDENGKKMSKSKGNVIDPMEIINQYGTDTLRWYLSTSVSNGSDLSFQKDKLLASRNFINKVWNISRFIKLNISSNILTEKNNTLFQEKILLLPEKVLLSQLSQLITKVNLLHEKYEFNIIGHLLYHFIWEDFSNWGLEFLKHFFKNKDNNLNTQKFVFYIWEQILKLLHPFIPFVTNNIYYELTKKSIINTNWPQINYNNKKDLVYFESIKNLIIRMRNFRKNYQVDKNDVFKLYIKTSQKKIENCIPLLPILKKFFKISNIEIKFKTPNKKYCVLFSEKNISLFIDKDILSKLKNINLENDILKQKKNILSEIQRSEKILNNSYFLEKASSAKIKEEKEKYKKYLQQYKELLKNDSI
ncbi:valine--tRNA ligase [Candidatus Phytoplasma pini]|uniref:Valine--tRNA ligase n=1 Tax=Candidatus Phytoplasma pini TaxID=267362 RepID=A0A559KJW3_9MOLU|nr:valine--tRNA ligase [Candidatus Phytoplasma pini]TVY12424.1 Valyl-tRNA synthetase [Candidatus Phytoplasma pini]